MRIELALCVFRPQGMLSMLSQTSEGMEATLVTEERRSGDDNRTKYTVACVGARFVPLQA